MQVKTEASYFYHVWTNLSKCLLSDFRVTYSITRHFWRRASDLPTNTFSLFFLCVVKTVPSFPLHCLNQTTRESDERDLKKAFDRAWHEELCHVLRSFHVEESLVRTIARLGGPQESPSSRNWSGSSDVTPCRRQSSMVIRSAVHRRTFSCGHKTGWRELRSVTTTLPLVPPLSDLLWNEMNEMTKECSTSVKT